MHNLFRNSLKKIILKERINLPNIKHSKQHALMEHILRIFNIQLKERIQFNVQQHSNQQLFFKLEHIRYII